MRTAGSRVHMIQSPEDEFRSHGKFAEVRVVEMRGLSRMARCLNPFAAFADGLVGRWSSMSCSCVCRNLKAINPVCE